MLVVRYNREPFEAVVVSLGRKYIGVSRVGEEDIPATKFNNDDRMERSDWSSERLFLGTLEEYREAARKSEESYGLYLDIHNHMSASLGLLRLKAIKAVMDSPTLEEAECKIHELVVYGQG